MKTQEKRHARRFGLALPVVLMTGDRKKAPRTIRTRDISSTGVLLQYDEQVLPGTTMEMVLTMPESVTQTAPVQLRCMGRVVRVARARRNRMDVAVKIDRYEFMRVGDKPARKALLHRNGRTTQAATIS